jgi:hypothetical protein
MTLYCAVSWKLVKKEGMYTSVRAVASAGTIVVGIYRLVSYVRRYWSLSTDIPIAGRSIC